MTTVALPYGSVEPVAVVRPRAAFLDRLRGVAIALMVLDHLLYLFAPPTGVPGLLRHTLTRAAMPLFFVLGGHLCNRLRWRHLGIFAVGLVLPLLVPWVDSPNVLCWYVLGAVSIRLVERVGGSAAPVLMWALVAVTLTKYANYYDVTPVGDSYNSGALLALMLVGRLMPRHMFTFGDALPAFFARVGRYPLTVYVGHLLVLQALITAALRTR